MRTLYEVLHEVRTRTVEIHVFDEMFLSMMKRVRNATETVLWYKIKYGGDST